MIKAQNFAYDELHVIVFALSKFDQVRYDYYDQVRVDISKKRREIVSKTVQGPERKK